MRAHDGLFCLLRPVLGLVLVRLPDRPVLGLGYDLGLPDLDRHRQVLHFYLGVSVHGADWPWLMLHAIPNKKPRFALDLAGNPPLWMDWSRHDPIDWSGPFSSLGAL